MLEAMSAGCLVIASDTPPITEVINNKVNGLLFNFFDIHQLTVIVTDALQNHDRYIPIRKAARETIINNYDFTNHILPKHLELINQLTTV
jgi:glycosyltransferase involved in cell wall biosynthesis